MPFGRRLLVRLVATVALGASASALAGCGSSGPEVAEATRFCELTAEIETIRSPADTAERELTADEVAGVQAALAELEAVVPDDLREDFLLRYWPHTAGPSLRLPDWVDTSGVRAQQAYDTWRDLIAANCG